MKRISLPQLVRSLTIAAAATLFLAMPGQRAQAMSLITPGASPVANTTDDGLIQVRGGGHGGGGHGGGGFHGGGFHGGGFHGGGFHGGGFHGGGFHGFHGGGFHHFGGQRFGHFHHRHFFRGGYYPYYGYGYYHRPYCHIVRTYYGLRRVCGWHRWHHRRYYW
jgi:uncharacterized membrane protein